MAGQQRLRAGLATSVAVGALMASLATGLHAGAAERAFRPAKAAIVAEQQPAPDTKAPPSELAREGLAKMLQALDSLIEAVPQFHMPEITENGDIILRRKQPGAPAQPVQQPPTNAMPI